MKKIIISMVLCFALVISAVACVEKEDPAPKSLDVSNGESSSSDSDFLAVKMRVKKEFIDPMLSFSDKSYELYDMYTSGLITEEEYDSKMAPLNSEMEKIKDRIRPQSIEEKVTIAMAKSPDDILTFDEVIALKFYSDSFYEGLDMIKTHHKIHTQYENGSITKEEANKQIEELDRKYKEADNKAKPYFNRIIPYLMEGDSNPDNKKMNPEE